VSGRTYLARNAASLLITAFRQWNYYENLMTLGEIIDDFAICH
jgi:hypothetical protein